MTDLLLIIAIALLVIVTILLLVLLFKKTGGSNALTNDQARKLLEEGRISSLKDFQETIQRQNAEINILKEAIGKGMIEAQKANQGDLFKFLDSTKQTLNNLQTNFNKETSEVKEKNLTSIKDLIAQTSKDLQELKAKILREMNETNLANNAHINEQNVKTQSEINKQITTLRDQVQKSLESGFEKNEKAMQDFIKQTASIEAASAQIEELRKEIFKFNNILSNQKTRGNFGEDVLEQIFSAIFGNNPQQSFYRTQVDFTKEFGVKQIKGDDGLNKNVIVDFLFNVMTEHGVLPLSIDAKFPYTNYLPLLDDTLSTEQREEAKKRFRIDVKARIKEVTKYIVKGQTAPYAIMFVPAEAVFIDIFKEFPEIVEEARSQKIIIASPSLIISIIQILQFILQDYQRRNNADRILTLVDEIAEQFRLFNERWTKLKKSIDTVNGDVKSIDITSTKMIAGFNAANQYASQTKLIDVTKKGNAEGDDSSGQ